VAFRGDTQSLLPLYMIGVCRVVHALAGGHGHPLADVEDAGVETSAAINGFGALVTGIVLVIVAVTKNP